MQYHTFHALQREVTATHRFNSQQYAYKHSFPPLYNASYSIKLEKLIKYYAKSSASYSGRP